MEVQDAEDCFIIDRRGRVLLCVGDSEMAIEVLYIHNLLENMGFAHWQAPDIPVYEDNAACMEWGYHVIGGRVRAKHIDIRKHFAQEKIQNRKMRLFKVNTSSQLADIFTKQLNCSSFSPAEKGD